MKREMFCFSEKRKGFFWKKKKRIKMTQRVW